MRQSVKTKLEFSPQAVLVDGDIGGVGSGLRPPKTRRDPKYQSKGEQGPHFMRFPGTTEMIPYHIYVPMKWDKEHENCRWSSSLTGAQPSRQNRTIHAAHDPIRTLGQDR